MRFFFHVLLLLFGVVCPTEGRTQVEVRASVDRTAITLGESVGLKVVVSGDQGVVDTDPIQDAAVAPRGTTRSVNMVNGQFSREIIYQFELIPKNAGPFTIPPLPVHSGAGVSHTQPIRIEVTSSRQSPGKTDGDARVEAFVSNPAPYVGEYFLYTFKLYHRVQIVNAKFERPDFSGFTSAESGPQKSYDTVINGREYHVAEIAFVLAPLEAGDKDISPAVLTGDLVRQRPGPRGFFDDPFFGTNRGRLESRTFRTDPVRIQVKPLPPDSQSEYFSGLVGAFSVAMEVGNTDLRVGDSVTVSVVVTGEGNLKDMAEPRLQIPDGFKVYTDSPEEELTPGEKGYAGKKIFRMALVPVEPGTYTLPPFRLRYFDGVKETYVSRETHAVTLTVRPSEIADHPGTVAAGPAGRPTKKAVEFTGRDILPLKEDLSALRGEGPLSLGVFLSWLAAPVLMFLGVMGILSVTRKSDDPARIMGERAEKDIKAASAGFSREEIFLKHLYRAVVSAVWRKAGTKGESLTSFEARRILTSQKVSPGSVERTCALLEKIESAKFGGVRMDGSRKKMLLKEARQVVRSLK